MKPKWENAPEWANYMAQDGDGEWWWYAEKPEPIGEDCWVPKDNGWARCKPPLATEGWENTLEERPL